MLPRLSRRSLLLAILLAAPAAPARAQFGPIQPIGTGGSSGRDAQPADLDGDGDADVLAAYFLEPGLQWHENLGGGAFGPAQPFTTGPLDLPLHLVETVRALDHDGDGDLDVFAATEHYTPTFGQWHRIDLFRNLGGGLFEPADGLYATAGSALSLRLVDLENDGDLDVTWAEYGSGAVRVIKSLPGGTLSTAIELTSIANEPSQMQPADHDADGDADLAVASAAHDHVIRFENRDGDTLFGQLVVVDANAPGAFAVNLADLDDDGYAEMFSTRSVGFDAAVTLYRNTGGDFAAPEVVSTIGFPTAGIHGSDVDADGDADLLVAEFYGASWYPNDGAGNLGARQMITEAAVSVDVAVPADLDGDGLLDVLLSYDSSGPSIVAWLKNLGAAGSPWTDLGFGLAGVAGVPQLHGTGTLLAGSPGSLSLTSAAPSAPALLFLSLASTPTPFKCGTLVPVPVLATLPLATEASGGFALSWLAWPAGLGGQALFLQVAVQDPAGPCGASLSTALQADVP